MLECMGIVKAEVEEFDNIFDKYEIEVCRGQKHVDELVPILKKKFNLSIPDDFSIQKYLIDHFEPNPSINPVLDLTQDTRRGLLTDQYTGMFDQVVERGLVNKEDWEVIIDSSIVNEKKPMPQIYQVAEERTGLSGPDILFIDNRQKNLEPAKQRGWQTYFYDSRDYEKSSQKLTQFLAENL